MIKESKIRQDVRKYSSRILYEDDRYIVSESSVEVDTHNLLVNDVYVFLARGVFNGLARANARRLRLGLEVVGERVLNELLLKNIPLEELGWVLAKAAIRDKELCAS